MIEKAIHHQKGRDPYYKVLHTTVDNVILYVHEGSGSIVVAERSYPLIRGNLYFIGADKMHYTLPDVPEIYDRSKIFINNTMLDSLLALFTDGIRARETFRTNSLVHAVLTNAECEQVEDLFEKVRSLSNDPLYGQTEALGCVLSLLVLLHKNTNDSIILAPSPLQQAIEYINGHLCEAICVENICRAVHISKYYFCHKFKEITGLTVMQYVLKTRLVNAQILLKETTAPITEISEQCGFSSISHFSRTFKKEYGLTPREFRSVERFQTKNTSITRV